MTRDELLSFTFLEDNHVNMFYMQDKVDILLNSLEEQNQGLQSLLDLKQQEISVLKGKIARLEEQYDNLHLCFVSQSKAFKNKKQN